MRNYWTSKGTVRIVPRRLNWRAIAAGLFCGLMAATVFSAHAQSWLTDGLIGYYPFNGNANDESGMGSSGTLLGSPSPTTDRFDAANRSYQFHAGSDSVLLKNVAVSTTANARTTVSFWMMWDGVFYSTSDRGSICFSFSPSYHLFIQGQGPGRLGFGTGQGDVWGIDYNSSIANQWIHVVGIFNNGNTRENTLYLDGVKMVCTMTMGGSPSDGSWNSSVNPKAVISGWDPDIAANSYRFSGKLDDVRIYNRALSPSEIQSLHDYESEAKACITHRAKATAIVVNGFLVGATITDAGCGYTNAPVVLIRGTGTGATATAEVNNGSVTGITINNAGSGYTAEGTQILIASPPFMPSLTVAVKRVKVTLSVVLGRKYVVESSTNLNEWQPTSPAFLAESESLDSEFDVDVTGRYFRIREVP